MNDNELKNFATFNTLISPKIIAVAYWVISLIIVAGGSWIWTLPAMLATAVMLVLVRIVFELIMISFKNNEYLRRICEATESKQKD